MPKIGYARASSSSQDLDIQNAKLVAAGCEVIRSETASGASRDDRSELATVMEFLRDGDELVVHRLDRIGRSIRDVLNLALTAQRYQIRRRIFDTLLKRRIYHRFGASQFSGMILICFFFGGERLLLRSSEVDLRADERSPSRETGFRPACRTAERPRQKQAGQAPSGNRGAACQRVTQKFIATRKLADEARNQETKSVKSYGGFGTFEPLGPSIRLNPFPVGPMSQVEKTIANFSYQKLITKLPNLVLCDVNLRGIKRLSELSEDA